MIVQDMRFLPVREGDFLTWAGREDRAALEKQLADTQASMQGRLKRIEHEVGSGPKAVWAGAKNHPVLSALAAVTAGLLIGKMIFRRRASRRTQAIGVPDSPAASGAPGGLRSLFWGTILQTGIGLAADFAADLLAGRSGASLQRFRKKRDGNELEGGMPRDKGEKTYDTPQ